MLEVIATERAKSRLSSGAVTAWIDSELVRTRSPSRADRRGRAPLCLQSASSWFVPSAPAATTTPRAVRVRARASQPCAGVHGRDRVAVRAVGRPEGADLDRLSLGQDLGAEPLREPEVVLDQGVLGAVAAADHAAAAADAAGSRRALAAEVRVVAPPCRARRRRPRRACGLKVSPTPIWLAVLAQQLVGRGHPLVLGRRRACARRCRSGAEAPPPSRRARPTAGRRRTRGGRGRGCSRSRGCRRRRRCPETMNTSLNSVRRKMPRRPRRGDQK